MLKTMKLGPLGRMVELPYPDSGMGFENNADVEVTELVGGGRAIYREPVTFKSFDMSWTGGLRRGRALKPLIDLFNGAYISAPDDGQLLYMIDPMAGEENLLPARWATSWQLAYCANGIHRPQLVSVTRSTYPSRRAVKFTSASVSTAEALSRHLEVNVPLEKGRVPFFNVWGSSTANSGIDVRLRNASTGLWEAPVRRLPASDVAGVPLALMTEENALEGKYDAAKLAIMVEHGGTLTLEHMALGYTWDYRSEETAFVPGEGVGALQFTGNLGGSLNSVTIDRIGLSVNLTEVRNAPSDLP